MKTTFYEFGALSAEYYDCFVLHEKARKEVDFLIRALNLKSGQTVLDIPCGTGRHSLFFGKRGFHVLGVDISDACLKRAKKNCQSIRNIQFKKGSMENLNLAKGRSDIVINMNTSFGYFKTKKKNERVFSELVNTLKPGGWLVIQAINREWVQKNLYDKVNKDETNVFKVWKRRAFDSESNTGLCNYFYFHKLTGQYERLCAQVKIYSIPEMKALFQKHKLSDIKVFGNISGSEAKRKESVYPIYMGQCL